MIVIPDELYVGYKDCGNDKECYTAYGISPNESKRKAKMRTIERRSDFVKTHKNVPLPGFTLASKNGTSRWAYSTKSDNYWTVIDPRGYKYTLTSENVVNIVSCSGITEGLIQSKCVWGYNSGTMELLPVNSEPYQKATKNTEIISSRVFLKDLQRGDVVLLQNKLKGVFLGGWYEIQTPSTCYSYTTKKEFAKPKYQYVMRFEDASGAILGYYVTSSLKVSKVVSKCTTPLEIEDIQKELNDELETHSRFSTSSSMSMYTRYLSNRLYNNNSRFAIRFVSKKSEKVDVNLVEVPFDEFTELDQRDIVVEDDKGTKYHGYRLSSLSDQQLRQIESIDFDSTPKIMHLSKPTQNQNRFSRMSPYIHKDLRSMSKYYKIVYKHNNEEIL